MPTPSHSPVDPFGDGSPAGSTRFSRPSAIDAAQSELICRTGDRLLGAWGVAFGVGDEREVERIVRRSRAAASARRQVARDERRIG